MNLEQKLEQLAGKLDRLLQAHERNTSEIQSLKLQIRDLQNEIKGKPQVSSESKPLKTTEEIILFEHQEVPEISISAPESLKGKEEKPGTPKQKLSLKKRKSDLEQFIGGNLINKIGIVILITGLGLFVKYAIDNGFFPPLLRLALSFLAGLLLVFIGYRLKEKYKTYSAVLFSGGMAVLYFSAYSGNVFFDPAILPGSTSFILMVVFTIVTVIAAAMYNLQIIGLLGLVGAYAVPFLLGDPDGDFRLLLSYVAVIDVGVLILAVRKNWKLLTHSAFFLTWLIFTYWWATEFDFETDYSTAWFLLTIFFAIFYAAVLGYAFFHQKQFSISAIILVTMNAFVFYGIGIGLLDDGGQNELQGLFTAGNGILHLIFSIWAYKKLEDKKLVYVLAGLFLTFMTIAIPVQFEGDVIPILWISEAVILFYIGRKFKLALSEVLSYMVLSLAFLLLLDSWNEHYYEARIHETFLWNEHFLTSIFMIFGLVILNVINQKTIPVQESRGLEMSFGNLILPLILIIVTYFSIYNEIYHHFDQLFLNSENAGNYDYTYQNYRVVWLINYTFVFIALLGLVNLIRWKNKILDFIVIIIGLLALAVFLAIGIWELNVLRGSFLDPDAAINSGMMIGIRYISYVLAALLLYVIYRTIRASQEFQVVRPFFPLIIHFIILFVLSNELTTVMQLRFGIETKSLAHKVGYSILWGLYSLMLIGIGFWKKSQMLRVAAIVLFAITLIKVFVVDLESMSTISRTVLFIALGVLLLIISYLYQRYKDVLLGEED